MRVTLTTIIPFLVLLTASFFTVSSAEQRHGTEAGKYKGRSGKSIMRRQLQDSMMQPPRIDQKNPSSKITEIPPLLPPYDGSNGGSDGRSSRVVFFVSPPLENGEHEIVVPLTRYSSSGGWTGVNNLFTNIDLNAEKQPGISIQNAAFVEGPQDHPVGCVFFASMRAADVVPMPIFYGEFFQKPFPRVTSVMCSTQLHQAYEFHDRYNVWINEDLT